VRGSIRSRDIAEKVGAALTREGDGSTIPSRSALRTEALAAPQSTLGRRGV
jgi:hypothetical protein